ncbi:DUF421 domain-containing protein [Rhodohalobacter sp. SW132]|uniref:DUF421 domain-containing protein n=1 Tax=Rhodohalobacter sp. SW132 TaxID=2293433 RepID=UPI000E2331A9|nr:YetF domain-containing protein [Rhodohalobacter sp. SW132]REL33856.1 DUF421 domain-containing protein [Rhodohalobacter sp. SW132]
MIDWSWITTTGTTLLMILLSAAGIYIALMILTRITGLRSFSKMSSFDFAITVAIGTIIASTLLTDDPPLLAGAFGLTLLYGIQYIVSHSRRLSKTVELIVDNRPLLLMAGEKVLTDHLNTGRITEEDLKSKLREAGVVSEDQVLAVVLETTGDVSVMKRSDRISPWIFKGIRGEEHLSFMKDENQ